VKKTLKEISQVFQNTIQTKSERHYQDLEKGEKVVIDGKEFVKVKLKFVDTMDFNLAKHVDNLETENILLKNEIQELKEQSEKSDLKIEQLQTCTKNVFQENLRLKEQNHLDSTISKLTKQINDQKELIEIQKMNISGQGRKIQEQISDIYKKSFLIKNQERTIIQFSEENAKMLEDLNKLRKFGTNLLDYKENNRIQTYYENELKRNQVLVKRLSQRIFELENELRKQQDTENEPTTTANIRYKT